MKSSHAAVLALVGWYLIVPPPKAITDPRVRKVIDAKTPFVEWLAIRRFETASDCERVKKHLHHEAFKTFLCNLDAWDRDKHPDLPLDTIRCLQKNGQFLVSECVANDDPRLAN